LKLCSNHIILFFLILISSPLVGQSDEEAIKRVIEKESTAYFNVDYKTWSETWVQAPHAYWAYTDISGTRFLEGWDTMKTSLAGYFKSAQPSSGEITNQWLEVRVYEGGAYVRFTQVVTDGTDRTETTQIRVLEKLNGQWRVVCMQATDRTPSR
jgi:hypothetical protein